MKDIISGTDFTEGVSLVTVNGITNNAALIASLLDLIAGDGINVDMISLSPLVKGSEASLSFTLRDCDLARAIGVIGKFSAKIPGIKTEVNSGNTKIRVFGKAMTDTPGVAARLFGALARSQVEVRLITTSDADISFLVSEGDTDKAAEALKSEFGV